MLKILLIVVGLLFLLSYLSSQEKYKFLGGLYFPTEGGSRSELNPDCLTGQALQCMLTDGTPGNCVTSGHCVANMLIDLQQEKDDIKKPYCVQPVFKEGCVQFCQCKALKGEIDADKCIENCLSWYSPIPSSFPI